MGICSSQIEDEEASSVSLKVNNAINIPGSFADRIITAVY
jgi:hypothetical protein